MTVMTDIEEEVLAEFRERMIGQRSGDATVIDVRFKELWGRDWDGYIEIALVLAEPPPELDHWPVDDGFALRQRGYAEARRLRVREPYVITTNYPPDPDEDFEDGAAEVDR